MIATSMPHAERTAGSLPGLPPRLIVPESVAGPLSLDAELALGTYGPACCADLTEEIGRAGLRGRGGAAFPADVKWRAVRQASGPKVVVANGEEGEPTSYKDRWLLTHRPHLVLDGLFAAARAVGAQRAVVYLAHPETTDAIAAAIADARSADLVPPGLRLSVHTVEPAYVAGEETAVCRAINGGPALPAAKPPRPFEQGVNALPTLVSNVETLAHAAWISRHGAESFRSVGTESSPGTLLVTLSGACAGPGVYEVPFGLSLARLFESVAGGFTSAPRSFVMAGWFGGILSAERADELCCYDALRAIDSGLGCAAITVLGEHDDPLAVAADIAAWYADESAGQCGVCVNATVAIRDTMRKLHGGHAGTDDRDKLTQWGQRLPRRGACAFLDGAAAWARTVIDELPDVVAQRLAPTAAQHANKPSDEGEV